MNRSGLAVMMALVVVAPVHGWACSCAGRGPVPEAFEQADVVFVARATDVGRSDTLLGLAGVIVRHLWSEFTGHDDPYLDGWERSPRNGRVAHMDVIEVFKGGLAATTRVYTGFGGGDCGYAFEEGREYVVYGYLADDALRPGVTFLTTNICSRTRPANQAPEELDQLRHLAPGRGE